MKDLRKRGSFNKLFNLRVLLSDFYFLEHLNATALKDRVSPSYLLDNLQTAASTDFVDLSFPLLAIYLLIFLFLCSYL